MYSKYILYDSLDTFAETSEKITKIDFQQLYRDRLETRKLAYAQFLMIDGVDEQIACAQADAVYDPVLKEDLSGDIQQLKETLQELGVRSVSKESEKGSSGHLRRFSNVKHLARVSLEDDEARFYPWDERDTWSPVLLKPILSKKAGRFRIEIFPEVDTDPEKITQGHIRFLMDMALACGDLFWDVKKENIGLLKSGLPVVLDPGAVCPLNQLKDASLIKEFLQRLRMVMPLEADKDLEDRFLPRDENVRANIKKAFGHFENDLHSIIGSVMSPGENGCFAELASRASTHFENDLRSIIDSENGCFAEPASKAEGDNTDFFATLGKAKDAGSLYVSNWDWHPVDPTGNIINARAAVQKLYAEQQQQHVKELGLEYDTINKVIPDSMQNRFRRGLWDEITEKGHDVGSIRLLAAEAVRSGKMNWRGSAYSSHLGHEARERWREYKKDLTRGNLLKNVVTQAILVNNARNPLNSTWAKDSFGDKRAFDIILDAAAAGADKVEKAKDKMEFCTVLNRVGKNEDLDHEGSHKTMARLLKRYLPDDPKRDLWLFDHLADNACYDCYERQIAGAISAAVPAQEEKQEKNVYMIPAETWRNWSDDQRRDWKKRYACLVTIMVGIFGLQQKETEMKAKTPLVPSLPVAESALSPS